MSTHKITDIRAESIPDSRGNPTLSVTVVTGNTSGTFSVPSGASTGTKEACELRDKDCGMHTAIAGLETEIRAALIGMNVEDQSTLDAAMIALDGTEFKSRLGGNTLIGVSIAAAKAAAAAQEMEPFQYLRTLADIKPSRRTPLLYLNYINGGKHAHSPLSFQEHMMVPETDSVTESLAMAEKIGSVLEQSIADRYGTDASHALGDEGGYVIQEKNLEVPFELLEAAIAAAGFAGRAHIAADIAASSFYNEGVYEVGGDILSPDALSLAYRKLTERFPILSIEDPFFEESEVDFAKLQSQISARVVGDDLTVTSAPRIEAAARVGAIKAVIIKPNQVGTLTETLAAMRTARDNDIDCIVSHRSGETMDDFIADLAYAFGCFGLKSGALRKSERAVKYKRLEVISAEK